MGTDIADATVHLKPPHGSGIWIVRATLMLAHLEHDNVSSCWVTKARCLNISLNFFLHHPLHILSVCLSFSLYLSVFLFSLQGSRVAWDSL